MFNYDSPLTAQQFEMMIKKAITVYEAETGHLERDEHKVKLRPSEENRRLPNGRGGGGRHLHTCGGRRTEHLHTKRLPSICNQGDVDELQEDHSGMGPRNG